jgi:hypothetical protein
MNSHKAPIQPWLRSLDGLNTHDEGYGLARLGGVTTAPGSIGNIGMNPPIIDRLGHGSSSSPFDLVDRRLTSSYEKQKNAHPHQCSWNLDILRTDRILTTIYCQDGGI